MKLKRLLFCIVLISLFILNGSIIVYSENSSEMSGETETLSEQESEAGTNLANVENQKSVDDPLGLTAESAILIDANSGVILYEKNSREKLFPASITKIMTSILTLENCKLADILKHSHNSVYNIEPGSSIIGMREDEEITVEQALHGVLMASANEVCMALAEHIDGSVEKFVERMNEKAKALGAENTHFANPHGFHDENHYTTAYDMSLFMKEAVSNEKFVEILSTYAYNIPVTNKCDEIRYLHNTNKFINPHSPFFYDKCIGGKTGFTDEAGNTLVTYAKQGDIYLISVVMKDKGTEIYVDSKKLMEYGFEMFENKELVAADDFVGTTSVIQNFHNKKNDLGKISVILKEAYSPYVPNFIEKEDIRTKINLIEEIEGPVNIGDAVGTMELYYGDKKIGETELISNTKVELIPEQELIEQENHEIFMQKVYFILKIGFITIGIVLFIAAVLFLYDRFSEKGKKRRLYKKRGRTYKLK